MSPDPIGPHQDQPAVLEQKHEAKLEVRKQYVFRLPWRFVCTCGTGSLWVETREYAAELMGMHHDMIILDDALREAFNKKARDSI